MKNHEKITTEDLINYAVEGLQDEIEQRLKCSYEEKFIEDFDFLANTFDLMISYNNILRYCTHECDYCVNTFGISYDTVCMIHDALMYTTENKKKEDLNYD